MSTPRTNNTVLAVVMAIVIVLGGMVAFGIFVAARILRNTHVVESREGAQKSVEIHSPLGNLRVDGSGNDAKVDIQSPFGSLKVRPQPDLNGLGVPVYPGATLVQSRRDSPFRGYDYDGMRFGGDKGDDAAGARVHLQSGGGALDIDIGEFRAPATPDQVLGYYDRELGKFGAVVRTREDDGATALKVKLSDKNVRMVAVKPGSDGTHFVLVRVVGDSGAK